MNSKDVVIELRSQILVFADGRYIVPVKCYSCIGPVESHEDEIVL